MSTMSEFQQITYHGEVAAVVIADQAIIPKALPAEDRKTVEAMCLYALEGVLEGVIRASSLMSRVWGRVMVRGG